MKPRTPTVEYRSLFGFYWFGICLWYLRDAAERRVAFPLLFLGAGLVLVQPCTGASGGFSNTGNLGTARFDHAATLLPNGKVLVEGGATCPSCRFGRSLINSTPVSTMGDMPRGVIASAELYDPASGTWMGTGSLAAARHVHTATLLPNGKVLVAAGQSETLSDASFLASVELYDPASESWTATGSLATARSGHTATLLPNGKVLVTGGFGSNSSGLSAELYGPASGTWTVTGSLRTWRSFHTATLLPSGQVLVAGGTGGSGTSAELYDPASETWTATGSLASTRSGHTATLLPSGQVLVAGGEHGGGVLASAELYGGQPTPPTLLLLNISTRMRVLTDDKVLIGGFIITGTDPKMVLIRGMGPSLNGVGVTLSDPTLELHQGSTTVKTNDNWKTRPDGTSQQAEIEATTIPPTNDLESAIVATLSPGAYTAILAGKNGGTGVGLVEVYDLGQGANSKLTNIGARGFVVAGDNVMIGGFVVGGGSGGGTARVIVRALGPSVPVAGALGDPTLELHDGSGTTIATNDNWKTRPDGSSQQAEIEATSIPPTNDLESALVRTLPPGNYTAIVRGKNSTTGVGLVETYNLP